MDLLALTSLDKMLVIMNTIFTLLQKRYLNEVVNCTDPSPSVGVPRLYLMEEHILDTNAGKQLS
jgi:hypothetical protein